MADPKIKYDIEAAVTGDASVQSLEKHLRDLGEALDGDLRKNALGAADAIQALGAKQGAVEGFRAIKNEADALGIELLEAQHAASQLGVQLAQSAERTQGFAAAEARARAALEGARSSLDQQRQALRDLNQQTIGVARSTDEYRQRKVQLQEDAQRLTAQIAQERAALKSAETQTKSAQQAQNALSAQYEASTTALARVRGAQMDANTAMEAGRERLRAAGIDAANLAQAERNLAGALDAARAEALQILPAYAKLTQATQQAGAAQEKTNKTFREGMNSISTQLQNIQNIATLALGGGFAAGLLRDVTDTADAFLNLSARVKLATGEGEGFERAFAGIKRVAVETHSALEGTGTLFTRISQAGKEFNLAQSDALALTKSINQAVQLSGGSAASADAAITQLIQGLQSGVLRGEEFNSVMEQAPRLAQALAAGLGVTTGELRKMANEGQLTTKVVIGALQNQRATLEAEFSQLPATVGRALTNLQTQWMLFVGEMDKSSNVTGYVANGINALAGNLDTLARIAAVAGAALTASLAVQGAAALRAYAAEAALAAGATNLLAASIAKVPRTINIAVGVTGFEIGYQIGEMLRENSTLARQFGVLLVGYFETVVSGLRLAKEAAAAVFTSDTVDAAYQRFEERNAKVRAQIQEMMRDAERAPAKVGAAADAAGAQLGAAAAAAGAAGASMQQAGAAGAVALGAAAKEAGSVLPLLQEIIKITQEPSPKAGLLRGLAAQIEEAKKKGADLEKILRQELPEAISKLSGEELARFRQEFILAMSQAGVKGKELEHGLELIALKAAQSLGVDVVMSASRVGEAFRRADADMRVLIQSLPQLRAAGVDTGTVVAQALSKMLDGAKNQAEIDAVIARINALRKELGTKMADSLLDQAKVKAQELAVALDAAKPGINSVREALVQLGVKPQAELASLAQKAKQAFEVIRASGTASPREIHEAWRAMAEAAIAANNGVASATISAQAASHGFKVEVDGAGKAVIKSMGESAQSVRHLRMEMEEAGGAAKGVGDAAKDAGRDTEKAAEQATQSADSLVAMWFTAENAASKYAQAVNRAMWEAVHYAPQTEAGFAAMSAQANRMVDALEAIDAAQQQLERSSRGSDRALEDMRLRLLEIDGTEEEVAAARMRRERAQAEVELQRLQLEFERARVWKDAAKLDDLEKEISKQRELLGLLGQVEEKERQQRKKRADDRAKEEAEREREKDAAGGARPVGGASATGAAPAGQEGSPPAGGQVRNVRINLSLDGSARETISTDDDGAAAMERFMRGLETSKRKTGR